MPSTSSSSLPTGKGSRFKFLKRISPSTSQQETRTSPPSRKLSTTEESKVPLPTTDQLEAPTYTAELEAPTYADEPEASTSTDELESPTYTDEPEASTSTLAPDASTFIVGPEASTSTGVSRSTTDEPQFSPSTEEEPTIQLHFPDRGTFFVRIQIPPRQDPYGPAEVIGQLIGQVEVRLPKGSGRRKCKGIRLVWQTWGTLGVEVGKGERVYLVDEHVIEHLGERIMDESSWR